LSSVDQLSRAKLNARDLLPRSVSCRELNVWLLIYCNEPCMNRNLTTMRMTCNEIEKEVGIM
jgi:hypothetical protein